MRWIGLPSLLLWWASPGGRAAWISHLGTAGGRSRCGGKRSIYQSGPQLLSYHRRVLHSSERDEPLCVLFLLCPASRSPRLFANFLHCLRNPRVVVGRTAPRPIPPSPSSPHPLVVVKLKVPLLSLRPPGHHEESRPSTSCEQRPSEIMRTAITPVVPPLEHDAREGNGVQSNIPNSNLDCI